MHLKSPRLFAHPMTIIPKTAVPTMLLVALGTAIHLPAADFVWTGAKDNDWHTPGNWNPGSGVPGKDDHAIISGLTADTVIKLSRDTAVGSLTFDPQARFQCLIEGGRLLLGDGSRVTFKVLTQPGADGSQTIACLIHVSGRVHFSNENRWYLGAERLSLTGVITGTGEIVFGGVPEGTVIVSGANTGYTGSVTIEGGSLLMAHNDALGSGTDPVRMLGGQINLGSRISCTRDFVYEADARWTGQTYCELGGTVTVNKGVTWQITNGGGCPTKLTSAVQGEGDVHFVNHGTTIAGAAAGSLNGVTTFGGERGETRLAKPAGVTAVAGPVVMSAMGTLLWDADDQIADGAPLTFNGNNPTLALNGRSEALGPLDLQSDGVIDLGDAGARLVFAGSSGRTWKSGCALIIRNGGKERGTIHFGSGPGGLTGGQLAQIGFLDPAGYPPGTYTAMLSASGEVMPTGKRVEPVDLPIDMSAEAYEARRALYDIPGLERLSGPATPLKQNMVISVFGDSITWGGGLVKTLQDGLREGAGTKSLGVRVINHGVNGAGVRDIRDGQDSKNHSGNQKPEPFAQTIAADKADVAVIYIGVNDVWWKKSTPEEYGRMLRELVDQARANQTVPVLATLALLKDSPLKPNPDCDIYADVMRGVARETGTVLVDLRAAFMACLANEGITVRPGGSWTCDDKWLNHDGVHTNSLGDRLLANLIAQGIHDALMERKPE
jgi:autotransporter-associated beta strand protein